MIKTSSMSAAEAVQVDLLLTWFFLHYLYRSLYFPLKMSNHSKIPLGISIVAFCYNTLNGYLQVCDLMNRKLYASNGYYYYHHHYRVPSWQYIMGVILGMLGFVMAYTSDEILLRLTVKTNQKNTLSPTYNINHHRKPHHHSHPINSDINNKHDDDKGHEYQIPYGGMFRYVSSPHYLGEIIEWMGFCLACNVSLASLSFLIWTCANLIPRAYATHQWYYYQFRNEYPPLHRKAIIPGIF
jgi:3-oxo-5-alpha-steroid 4-dehydrogenase